MAVKARTAAGIAAGVSVGLAIAAGGATLPPAYRGAPAPATTDAEARCRALVGRITNLPDAPTTVSSASLVTAGARLPAYCNVKATIRPHVGFELRLPVSGWNHKFLEIARGGFCRPVMMAECNSPLRKGYACAISDDGNPTSNQDDVWAYGDTQNKVDCGFRAPHVTAVAAKAITEAFYAERPRRSYLTGCSTGGRLAMVEAERFPSDFDGIVAGAAPVSKYHNGVSLAWDAVAVLDADGRQILNPRDVRLLHAAVISECDALDGLKDGVVGAPHTCRFDPGQLQCRSGKPSGCLTAEQVAAVRKIYAGPTTSGGRPLYNAAPLPGSELGWIDAFVSKDARPSPLFISMTAMFRHLSYPAKRADWTIRQMDWDTVAAEVEMAEAYADATNPDLRRFKARGGKLIAYHGLHDPFVLPDNYADYYETVQKAMGGPQETRDFFRLFQVPGMYHCSGGEGAWAIDYLGALDAWVEGGPAPEALIGAHPIGPETEGVDLPLQPARIAFTRPVFAYPAVTRYRGSGDPNAAASFQPAERPR